MTPRTDFDPSVTPRPRADLEPPPDFEDVTERNVAFHRPQYRDDGIERLIRAEHRRMWLEVAVILAVCGVSAIAIWRAWS